MDWDISEGKRKLEEIMEEYIKGCDNWKKGVG